MTCIGRFHLEEQERVISARKLVLSLLEFPDSCDIGIMASLVRPLHPSMEAMKKAMTCVEYKTEMLSLYSTNILAAHGDETLDDVSMLDQDEHSENETIKITRLIHLALARNSLCGKGIYARDNQNYTRSVKNISSAK